MRPFFSFEISRHLVRLAVVGVLMGGALPLPFSVSRAVAAERIESTADWWIDVANDRVDSVKTQLQLGVDPNSVTPKGQPAMMEAMRDNAWKTYDVLAADPRTRVNVTNISDETPLMYLALLGQLDRARYLIGRGAQINRLGWTPLHYAASRGHADVAQLLIAHKAIINAPAPDGTTPLMMAAFADSRQTVDLLLKAGAEPTTRNLAGLNAADWARSKKSTILAKYLDGIVAQSVAERARREQRDIRADEAANRAGGSASDSSGVVHDASPDATHSTMPDASPDAARSAVSGNASGASHGGSPGGAPAAPAPTSAGTTEQGASGSKNEVKGVNGVGLSW